jgi:hypothetical protein
MDDPVEKLFQDFDKWNKQHGVDLFLVEVIYHYNK